MAVQTKAFWVGTFVVAGLVIGIAALIWLGLADWFAKTNTYVTYFDASVQGLNPDSDVKFRGVTVGKVKAIKVAPDNYLIEVTMELEPKFKVDSGLRASLGFTGITGLRYIELNYVEPEKLAQHPKLTFEPPFPVIPSTPGGFEEIEQSFRQIYDKLVTVDTEGISIRAKHFLDAGIATFNTADSVLHEPSLTGWAKRLDRTVQHADSLLSAIDTPYHDAQLDSALRQLQQGAVHFNELFARLDKQASELKVSGQADSLFAQARELVHSSQNLIDRSQYASLQTLNNLNATINDLNSAINQLNSLMMSVESYPSNILFTAPPPKEK